MFFAMRSIEKLILKLTLFLYSALNCGLSFKVSITLGNFLNCPKILKLWNLFVSSKLSNNRKGSQGGEKDSASYRLSAGCVKASKTAMVMSGEIYPKPNVKTSKTILI